MRKLVRGYLIHSIPYQERSVIACLYTKDFGKISVIAKGVRQKNHKWRSLLTTFNPLIFDIKLSSNMGGLAQLYSVEQHTKPNQYQNYLVTLSLFYVNELIYILIPPAQGDEFFFQTYEDVLRTISQRNLNTRLRYFELKLIESLGYGLDYEYDDNHMSLEDNSYYCITAMSLPIKVKDKKTQSNNIFKGNLLKKLSGAKFETYSEDMLKALKYILKLNINYLLEGKPLKSRQLVKDFLEMKANTRETKIKLEGDS